MKMDDIPINDIAKKALQRAQGNPWRGYEYAKREVGALLENEPSHEYDSAVRRLADALRI